MLAVLKNPLLSLARAQPYLRTAMLNHAQNAVLNAEHAPWSTELTYFSIIFSRDSHVR